MNYSSNWWWFFFFVDDVLLIFDWTLTSMKTSFNIFHFLRCDFWYRLFFHLEEITTSLQLYLWKFFLTLYRLSSNLEGLHSSHHLYVFKKRHIQIFFWNNLNKNIDLLNIYAHHLERHSFWLDLEEQGILSTPSLILGGCLNLSMLDEERWRHNVKKDSLENFFLDLFEATNIDDITPH